MSIAVLTQVYDETRRLAIAGSNVAPGDFRLKKLIPPLEQAGAKAPVFAKVAQAVQGVVDSNEKTAPAALLELSSLVNAILYTQGETGCAGDLKPIETQDLGQQSTRTSARLLKPLLEALTTSGGGRIEVIRDAIERGLFGDLRLVRHALNALDDPYSEICELVAEKILPQYGRAILPELQSKLDLKGKKSGHLLRLKLLHQIDPQGARTIVKEALENGSKEIKVVAISCLGTAEEDLDFLLEQSQASAVDVRKAAFESLGRLSATPALEALEKALTGKDIELAVTPVQESGQPRLTKFVLEQAEAEVQTLLKLKKDKDKASKSASQLSALIRALPHNDEGAPTKFLLKLFADRENLAAIPGEPGGKDIVDLLVRVLAQASSATQKALIAVHADLSPDHLASAFDAATRILKPKEVYDQFSPYLLATGAEKKKGKDSGAAKQKVIRDAVDNLPRYARWYREERGNVEWDARWLEAAVTIGDRDLVCSLIKPGTKVAEKFLLDQYNTLYAKMKKGGNEWELREVLQAMAESKHPQLNASIMSLLEGLAKGSNQYAYYWFSFVPELPKSMLPELEALLAKFDGRNSDQFASAILDLKTKQE